ncbi:MAG TPA: hypothetical protein VN783_14615 [Thermoanaerobaculia bacterium]|nr:hypothetical protein [Thermoanaerobaculia bacterium]
MTDSSPSAHPAGAEGSGLPPGALPLLLDPDEWEQAEGFRFTFLGHFTKSGDADALRRVSQLLYDGALEGNREWPRGPLPPVLEQALLAACEFRFLEGFLAAVGRECETASLSREEIRISQLAADYSLASGDLAARIERDLAATGKVLVRRSSTSGDPSPRT